VWQGFRIGHFSAGLKIAQPFWKLSGIQQVSSLGACISSRTLRQFSAEERQHNVDVSHVRVHVERDIRQMKQFRLLGHLTNSMGPRNIENVVIGMWRCITRALTLARGQ
jgi:hypothetical protein